MNFRLRQLAVAVALAAAGWFTAAALILGWVFRNPVDRGAA